MILDKTYGHVTYGCMVCCGPDSPWMQYDPLDLLLDGFSYQAVQAVNSCSNRLVTITSDFPTWWTDNSSIATASGYQINGVGVGSTNHYAQSVLMYWGPKEDSGGEDCPLSQEVPSSPTNVQETGFLQIVSTATDTSMCSGNGCEAQVQYRVLDTNGANMKTPGMIVQEHTSLSGSCGPGSWSDSSTWTTNANGELIGLDHIHIRSSGTGSCQVIITQTLTVNGFPVLIMSSDRNRTGKKNVITINLTNNQSSCPAIVITP